MPSIIQGRWLWLYRGPVTIKVIWFDLMCLVNFSIRTICPKSSLFAVLWLFFQVRIWTHAPRSWNTTLPTLRASGQRSQTSRQPYNPTVDPWDSFTLLCIFVAVASLEEQHWFASPPSLLARKLSSLLPTQGLYLANYFWPSASWGWWELWSPRGSAPKPGFIAGEWDGSGACRDLLSRSYLHEPNLLWIQSQAPLFAAEVHVWPFPLTGV